MNDGRNDVSIWSEEELLNFTNEFKQIFPVESITKELHDVVKEHVSTQIQMIVVPSRIKGVIKQIWKFCFEEAFYPETVEGVYEEWLYKVVELFNKFNYSVNDAKIALKTFKSENVNPSVVGNILRSYYNELHDIIEHILVTRYCEVLEYDNMMISALIVMSGSSNE